MSIATISPYSAKPPCPRPKSSPSALSLQFVPICLQCRRALAAPLNSSPHFLGTLVTAHYINTLLGHTCTCTEDVEHFCKPQQHTRYCMILHTSSTHYLRALAPTTLQTFANHIETLLHISVHQHRMIHTSHNTAPLYTHLIYAELHTQTKPSRKMLYCYGLLSKIEGANCFH